MEKYKEYKVGEIFECNGYKLITTKSDLDKCEDCFFDSEKECLCPVFLVCEKSLREDNISVYFKKLNEIEELILKGSDKS